MTGDTRPDIPARGPVAACAVPVPDAAGQDALAAPGRSQEHGGAVTAGYSCTRCGSTDMARLGLSRVCLDAEACHGRQCGHLQGRAEAAEAEIARLRCHLDTLAKEHARHALAVSAHKGHADQQESRAIRAEKQLAQFARHAEEYDQLAERAAQGQRDADLVAELRKRIAALERSLARAGKEAHDG